MTREPINAPAARNWRDIPQPVKPRAMSRGGRLRLALTVLRGVLAVAVGLVVAWGGWKIVGALQENSQTMPAAAKAVPLQPPELVTTSGGVLDSRWLARTLALPRSVSLMEVNLDKVKARVLAESQVLTAKATRKSPDRLIVEITERMPIAKIRAEWRGRQQALLVARDGVVFAGEGYDAAMVAGLPWLGGVSLKRNGDGFQPIGGMEIVDELLTKAQLDAAHLYRSWEIISLERLAKDREIEVSTVEGIKIVFGVTDAAASELARRKNFIDQLARLDVIWEKIAHLPLARGSIDLTLGSEVPVRLEPAVASAEPAAAPRPIPSVRSLPPSTLQFSREL